MNRLLASIVSIRTTALLLVVLAALLLAALVVPQRAVVGNEIVAGIAAANPLYRFVIDTLGLGAIATSPVFITALALFYLNLIAVLIDRTPRTLARVRVRPPAPEAVDRWITSPHALEGTAAGPLEGSIAMTLRGFGYKPYRVSASSVYAVKHQLAAIGFLVFHVSFFFLCAGGLLIWYTRYVGETRAVEGQDVDAANARVVRLPKVGGAPDLKFTLEKMTPSFERGEATDLRASIRMSDGQRTESWVNHPAERGAVSILVNDVGLAPVFWLQDPQGFGLDRVAVPADRRNPVDIPLAGGDVRVRVLPPVRHAVFPQRDSLQTHPLDIVVHERNREVFRGALRTGEAATFPGGRLLLTEVRYWAGLQIISERGGGILVLGFVLATMGAVWRLLLHRRDLVVAWTGNMFRLAGHGEWFADRDRRELMAIHAALEKSQAAVVKTDVANNTEVTA